MQKFFILSILFTALSAHAGDKLAFHPARGDQDSTYCSSCESMAVEFVNDEVIELQFNEYGKNARITFRKDSGMTQTLENGENLPVYAAARGRGDNHFLVVEGGENQIRIWTTQHPSYMFFKRSN